MKYLYRFLLVAVYVVSVITIDHFGIIKDLAYWSLFGFIYGVVATILWIKTEII